MLLFRIPDFFDLVLSIVNTDDGNTFQRNPAGACVADVTGDGLESFCAGKSVTQCFAICAAGSADTIGDQTHRIKARYSDRAAGG